MPTLIEHNEQGGWQHDAAIDLEFVTTDNWQAGSNSPLLLTADDEPSEAHLSASLIAIDFATFNDGRGLSQAVLLRTRFGYEGELRAVGDVHQDILHYMVRCGFTSFVLPDDRDPNTAMELLSPYSQTYQASVVDPLPSFRKNLR